MHKVFAARNFELPTPLGPWVSMSIQDWMHNWDYLLSSDREFLYHKQPNNHWRRHLKKEYSHRSYHSQSLVLHELPLSADMLRVTVNVTDTIISVLSTASKEPTLPEDPDVLVFDIITVSVPKIQWFMSSLSSSPTTSILLDHIVKGTKVGVSDGSYFPTSQTGSCAWIISTPNGQEYIQGGGLIPGEGKDQDPYRSELGGQLGLTSFVTGIHLPPSCTPFITTACDGLSALNQVGLN